MKIKGVNSSMLEHMYRYICTARHTSLSVTCSLWKVFQEPSLQPEYINQPMSALANIKPILAATGLLWPRHPGGPAQLTKPWGVLLPLP